MLSVTSYLEYVITLLLNNHCSLNYARFLMLRIYHHLLLILLFEYVCGFLTTLQQLGPSWIMLRRIYRYVGKHGVTTVS